MAVILNFNICESGNCKELSFRETTGLFHASTNPTGWKTSGGASDDITLVTSAVLSITHPNGTITNIDLFATSNFPTTDTTFEHTITSAALGLSANSKIPDGLYVFKYTVVVTIAGPTEVTHEQTISEYLFCNTKCCVYSLFGKIPAKDCNCEEETISKSLKAFALLQSLIYAAGTGQVDKVVDLQTILNDICNSEDCNCK